MEGYMKKVLVLLIIGVFFVAAALLWWTNGTSAVDKNSTAPQTFIIPPGAGMKQIANQLKEQNLIKDPTVFYFLVKQLGIEKKIQAGSYRLSPAQSAEEIARSLTVGTEDIWVTIPEGKRAEEVADILEKSLPTYDESWREQLIVNEGYLFPDTYLFPKEAGIDMIINTMRGTFENRYSTIQNKTNLSKEEIVILASMIEREARHDVDRPIVSSVMHNRLAEGMPLQIDATVQYALGYDRGEGTWWKKGLTYDDLRISSSYNTYENAGLPPGPISNPGIAVLEAAANPSDTNYLFYITDKTGTNRYARTNDEHNANIKRYGL
jgi:UPF0755 protein